MHLIIKQAPETKTPLQECVYWEGYEDAMHTMTNDVCMPVLIVIYWFHVSYLLKKSTITRIFSL